MPAQHLGFGPFRLNLDNGTLVREGELVAIGQKGALLLGALLQSPGEVLTKAQLMNAGWQGAAVEESNLSVQIASLRKQLGPAPDGGEWIVTVPRVGYRFYGEVENVPPQSDVSGEKPSLAVLPFASIGKDPDEETFADGLVEDVITSLAKLAGLTIIAAHSTFAYKGRRIDVRQVAKELGVRYLLEGGVRKSDGRIRITAQLIDARTGRHAWTARYDRDLSDIFAVQDEITLSVATEMQVHLTEGDTARLHYTTTTNIEAWTHWVQGRAWNLKSPDREHRTQAQIHWEKALALDPKSAPLNAALAFVEFVNARDRRGDRATALAKATDYANRALTLDPNNGDAHAHLALISLAKGQFDEAVALARRALDLAPGSADVAGFASWTFASTGNPAEALVEIERAMRLSPITISHHYGHLGNAYRLLGRTDEAIAAFRRRHETAPGWGLVDLVLALEQSGRHAEARAEAQSLLAIRPNFSVRGWMDTQFRNDKTQLETDATSLRAVGLPD